MIRWIFCSLSALLTACAPIASAVSDEAETGDHGSMLFVANKRDASLSQISLASGEELRRAETCQDPHELAISPDQRHVAVACYGGAGLAIFRTDTLEQAGYVGLADGARPHGIVWHPTGKIVATAEGRGTIFVVDEPLSATPVAREIGDRSEVGPHMVVVDAAGTTAWGAVIPTDTVIRYDLDRGMETNRVVLSGRTEGIALTPDGEGLFVGTLEQNKVFRLDPDTLAPQTEIATGRVPIRVMAHPAGRYLVTSDLQDGALSVIDAEANRVVRTIPVSGGQDAVQVTVIFSPDGERLYVAETATDTIAEIDFANGKLLRRLRGGPGGDGLAVTE